MKLLKNLNSELDSIDVEKLESVELSEKADPQEVLSIIGLFAPVFIVILQAWKAIPGRRQEVRNMRLDKAIAALRIASVFSSMKFKQ